MNCALGPQPMRPYIEELAKVCTRTSVAIPTPGLPDEMGQYTLQPQQWPASVGEFIEQVG